MSLATELRKQLPFHFRTPAEDCRKLRDILYGRKVDGVEDKEDALLACVEVIENAMELAFRMGLLHGIEHGREIKGNL